MTNHITQDSIIFNVLFAYFISFQRDFLSMGHTKKLYSVRFQKKCFIIVCPLRQLLRVAVILGVLQIWLISKSYRCVAQATQDILHNYWRNTDYHLYIARIPKSSRMYANKVLKFLLHCVFLQNEIIVVCNYGNHFELLFGISLKSVL